MKICSLKFELKHRSRFVITTVVYAAHILIHSIQSFYARLDSVCMLLQLRRCEFKFPTFFTYILTEDILILNENSILHMNLWVKRPKSYDDCNGFFSLLEQNGGEWTALLVNIRMNFWKHCKYVLLSHPYI